MTEPPFVDQLLGRRWGTLRGHSRAFNKRSPSRGCSEAQALFPKQQVLTGFSAPQRRISLALGTVPGGQMTGEVMWWPEALRESLLNTLDQREGWWPQRGLSRCGYVRTQVAVEVDGQQVDAITYLSNPSGIFHCDGLSESEVATILIHSTPVERGPRALGAYYAWEIAEYLNQAGHPDMQIQPLLDRIKSQYGWPEGPIPPRV